jgi:hypothetical protein
MEKIPPVANPQPIPGRVSHRAVRRPVNGLLAIFEAEIDVKNVGCACSRQSRSTWRRGLPCEDGIS